MRLNELKIRDKLLCKISGNNGSEFLVRIEDVIDEQFFSTDLPVVSGGNIRFKPETILDFIYTTETGIIYFQGKVKKVGNKNNPSMIIQKVTDGERIQRREYFRLSLSLDCKVRSFQKIFEAGNNSFKAKIANISAGGIKFLTEENCLKKGEDFYIYFMGFGCIDGLWGNVVKVSKVINKENNFNFSFSAKFVYIEPKTQDELVRYLFDKQREMARLNIK